MADLSKVFQSSTPAEQERLLNGPALDPPEGIIPVFNDPPNQSDMARIIFSICIALTSILVFLRIYAVWFVTKKVHLADYMMLPAYALYVAFITVLFKEADAGLFVHQWNFRLRDVPTIFHLFHVATNVFAVDILIIKSMILIEWLRIFVPKGTRNYFYWICIGLLLVNFLFYTAGIITLNLVCIPQKKIWESIVPGKCIDRNPNDLFSASLSLVIDLAILLLPQKAIWDLHMTRNKKLGVAVVFAVGILGSGAAAGRLDATIQYPRGADATYKFSIVTLWVLGEMTCGLLIYCVPVLPNAVRGLGKIGIFRSLGVWASGTTGKNSDNMNGPSYEWPSPSLNRTKPSRYQELNESIALPLQTFGSQASISGSHTSQDGSRWVQGENSILRTTHLVTTVTEADTSDQSTEPRFQQQYTWSAGAWQEDKKQKGFSEEGKNKAYYGVR